VCARFPRRGMRVGVGMDARVQRFDGVHSGRWGAGAGCGRAASRHVTRRGSDPAGSAGCGKVPAGAARCGNPAASLIVRAGWGHAALHRGRRSAAELRARPERLRRSLRSGARAVHSRAAELRRVRGGSRVRHRSAPVRRPEDDVQGPGRGMWTDPQYLRCAPRLRRLRREFAVRPQHEHLRRVQQPDVRGSGVRMRARVARLRAAHHADRLRGLRGGVRVQHGVQPLRARPEVGRRQLRSG
jgi:hypothetical protein